MCPANMCEMLNASISMRSFLEHKKNRPGVNWYPLCRHGIKKPKNCIGGIFMAKKGSKFQKRTPEFKAEVMRRHLQEGVSTEVLAKEYQLEPRLIRAWRTLFLEHGPDGFKPKPKGPPKGAPALGRARTQFASELEQLQYENARLKLEVARLKKLQEL